MDIIDSFKANSVVAAVKDDKALSLALKSNVAVVFLLKSDLMSAADTVKKIKAAGKRVYVHLDLMDGIGKDEAGVKYVAERIRPDGIISTRPALIKCAKMLGLSTVFRVFLIDSQGLESAVFNAEKVRADAVEVMPGLIPEVLARFVHTGGAVIIGGLISTSRQIQNGLDAGAIAASTSNPDLW